MTVIVEHSMPEVIRAVCLPGAPQDGLDEILGEVIGMLLEDGIRAGA